MPNDKKKSNEANNKSISVKEADKRLAEIWDKADQIELDGIRALAKELKKKRNNQN